MIVCLFFSVGASGWWHFSFEKCEDREERESGWRSEGMIRLS